MGKMMHKIKKNKKSSHEIMKNSKSNWIQNTCNCVDYFSLIKFFFIFMLFQWNELTDRHIRVPEQKLKSTQKNERQKSNNWNWNLIKEICKWKLLWRTTKVQSNKSNNSIKKQPNQKRKNIVSSVHERSSSPKSLLRSFTICSLISHKKMEKKSTKHF